MTALPFSPAVECPWRDGWPLPAHTDDANGWIKVGCWLYRRREGVRVLWIGSVRAPGAVGDVYACGPCIAELDHMVRLRSHGRDEPPDRTDGATGTVACGHRRIGRLGGKVRYRDCGRQIYL
ncbi:hypothetical protein ACGRHY_15020 [Streptomyces sp. HK10]|uniref:hypothetical protein n=1 Tax=Streptomyces sp. HK10 TaxID=3373255 RepID=UPI0037479F27